MSIKKNGKTIASNYNYININDYNSFINEGIKKIQDESNIQINNVISTSTTEISKMENIYNNVVSTSNEKINQMDGILTNVLDVGEEQINLIETTATTQISEMNSISDTIKQLANVIGASTVGVERFWRGSISPVNYLIENGQLVSREEYSELYQWAIDNNLMVEDFDWVNNKKYGFYSYGDGSTTFRLPNMTGLYYVGFDQNYHTGLGIYQEDTLPDLSGTFNISGTNESSATMETTATGVFKTNTKTERAYPITGSTTLTDNIIENIELDLSTQVKISDRVQPRSLPVNFIVCYKNIWSN